MKKVFIRPKASLDIEEQVLFIAQDNLQAAYRFYQSCDETFHQLVKMPQMGQKYPAQQKKLISIRFFPVTGFERHLIFYISSKDRLEIIRILYATRDINKALKQ